MSYLINAGLSTSDIAQFPNLVAGMHAPRVSTLSGGQIYKFTSSKYSSAQQVASPWWFSDTEFGKLQQYLRIDPTNIGFLARLQGAVQYKWSDMDTLVVATVFHPICVFIGRGKSQFEKTDAGSTIIFQAPADLLQMYIPNIVDSNAHCLNAKGKLALGAFHYTRIPSGDEIDRTMLSLPGKTIVLAGNPSVH